MNELNDVDFNFKNLFSPLTTIKAISIIIIVGLVVFANSLFNEFVWDDLVLFFGGDEYRSIANIGYIFLDHSMPFYRPVHLVVLTTLYTLFSDNVFWFHLLEISLHIANACLLFILFKKSTPRTIALFLSLIFLVHPIQVESVSYISSMLNPLFVFLGLSAFFLAINTKVSIYIKYSVITILLLLCLLTKEAGFLFMILIPAYMIVVCKNIYNKKDYAFLCGSFFMALIPYVILRFFITNVASFSSYSPIPIINASVYERAITLPKIITFYISTFLFPQNLAISQNWIIKSPNFQNFYFPLLIDIAFFTFLIGGGIYVWKTEHKQLKIYLFFLLWFLLSWCIHWNILIPLDMTVADRWFYMPLIGLLGLVGVLLSSIKTIKRSLLVSLFILIILLLSYRTIERNQDWRNPMSLYQHDAKISTESYDLEMQLGEVLLNNGKPKEAKPHIDKALKLAPEFYSAWNVLGLYYVKMNQIDEALDAFSLSIKKNSGYNLAYVFSANVYYQYKSPQITKRYLESLLKKYPKDGYFFYLLGRTNYKLGDNKKGMEQVMNAYRLTNNPNYLEAYYQMTNGKNIQ